MTQTTLPVEQRERCAARKVDGTQCTRWARAGELECRQHAGLAAPRPPTGLSDEDQAALFEALMDGLSLDDAVIEAGVSRSTVYHWLERAREEGTHPAYREFEAGVAQARTMLQRQTLQQLKKAAEDGSVPAMRTILQRVSPGPATGRTGGQLQMPTEPNTKRTGQADVDQENENVIPLRPAAGDADF